MGWAKYAEDNFEFYCERSYMRERREIAPVTIMERTQPKTQVQKEARKAQKAIGKILPKEFIKGQIVDIVYSTLSDKFSSFLNYLLQ